MVCHEFQIVLDERLLLVKIQLSVHLFNNFALKCFCQISKISHRSFQLISHKIKENIHVNGTIKIILLFSTLSRLF